MFAFEHKACIAVLVWERCLTWIWGHKKEIRAAGTFGLVVLVFATIFWAIHAQFKKERENVRDRES